MFALIYPLSVWALLQKGGLWLWALVPFNILIVPIVDHLARALFPHWQPSERLLGFLFARPLFWLYTVTQAWVLVLALLYVSQHSLNAWEFMGLVSSVGLMTGTAGITAAHELIHHRSASDRGLGLALLSMVSYMHFRIEHVYGHHRHVATSLDPASARFGEDFPAFFARSMRLGLISAWQIEATRLHRQGKSAFSQENRTLRYLLLQGAILLGIGICLGPLTALFFILQSLMAVHLLEAVNYVQHYGLQRDVAGRIGPQHAWDACYPLAGLFSFRIDVHAHHHLSATQECTGLRYEADSPKLPLSFNLMVFIALIPPLWHRLMDQRARQLPDVSHSAEADLSPALTLHSSTP